MSSTDARIALLRQAMSRRGLSLTSCRPRTRTFPNTCRRAGRAALAVGLHGLGGHAGGHGRFRRLRVDSRYWVQAEAQLAGTGAC